MSTKRRDFIKQMTSLGLASMLPTSVAQITEEMVQSPIKEVVEDGNFIDEFFGDINGFENALVGIAPPSPTYHLVDELEEIEHFETIATNILKKLEDPDLPEMEYELLEQQIKALTSAYAKPEVGDIITVKKGASIHGTDYKYLGKGNYELIPDELTT